MGKRAMTRATGGSGETAIVAVPPDVGKMEGFLKDNVLQISRSAATFMRPDTVIRLARTMLIDTPDLLKCDPVTILGAVIQSAAIGLELDKHTGAAYLVPFWNTKRKVSEAQLIIGYRGYLRLARRSEEVTNIEGRQVRRSDEFSFQYGTNPGIKHIPSDRAFQGDEDSEDQYVAFYVCADILKSTRPQFDVLYKWQVDRIRAGRDTPAWRGHYGEMGMKTVMRRIAKWLPVSVEMQKAVTIDEMAALGMGQRLSSIVDRSMLKSGSMALPAPETDDEAGEVPQEKTGDQISGEAAKFHSALLELVDTMIEQGLDEPEVAKAVRRRKAQAMAQYVNDPASAQMIEEVADGVLKNLGGGESENG